MDKVICKNCGGESSLWGEKRGYKLYECSTCGLIFVFPLPNPESVYTQDYFTGAKGGFGYVDYDGDKEPMVPVFNKYLDLLKKFGKSGGNLFDIGAATGFFIKIAQKRGFNVSGVEFSDHAAGMGRRDGLDIKTGDMMSLSLPGDSFDVVTMLDVLEHMTEPFEELLEVKRILKKGGLVVVNSPNGQSILSKILKTKWHLVLPPEHLFYFSPKNLALFMEKNGFKMIYNKPIHKSFTLKYCFIMMYKWQKLSIWLRISELLSKGFLAKISIPIPTYDNFFVIFRKE